MNPTILQMVTETIEFVNAKLGGFDGSGGHFEPADFVLRVRFNAETRGGTKVAGAQWEASLGRLEGWGATPEAAIADMRKVVDLAVAEVARRNRRRSVRN